MAKSIGIYINPTKPQAHHVAHKLIRLLIKHGVEPVLDEDSARVLGRPDLGADLGAVHDKIHVVFVLGGDGTLLGVARRLAPYPIPILGINLGNLGFLSEAEPEDLEESLLRVLDGRYTVEERMMLATELVREGEVTHRFQALNDVGVAKGSFSRMVVTRVYVNGSYLGKYSGDGVLVSSPTGSTAYSLSAGGPIITPQVQALLLTFVAPHTLTARPIVFPSDDVVEIVMESDHEDLGLTIDGQLGVTLQQHDRVIVKRSDYTTRLVKLEAQSFFDVVRQKLQGEYPGLGEH